MPPVITMTVEAYQCKSALFLRCNKISAAIIATYGRINQIAKNTKAPLLTGLSALTNRMVVEDVMRIRAQIIAFNSFICVIPVCS